MGASPSQPLGGSQVNFLPHDLFHLNDIMKKQKTPKTVMEALRFNPAFISMTNYNLGNLLTNSIVMGWSVHGRAELGYPLLYRGKSEAKAVAAFLGVTCNPTPQKLQYET